MIREKPFVVNLREHVWPADAAGDHYGSKTEIAFLNFNVRFALKSRTRTGLRAH
jgi:hypothetical protein